MHCKCHVPMRGSGHITGRHHTEVKTIRGKAHTRGHHSIDVMIPERPKVAVAGKWQPLDQWPLASAQRPAIDQDREVKGELTTHSMRLMRSRAFRYENISRRTSSDRSRMDARAKRAIVTCLEELQQKEVLVFTETITKHHPRLRSSPCLPST